MQKRILTTIKVDQETFLQLHEKKPEGMTMTYFIRRTIKEKEEAVEKAQKLSIELLEARQNFTALALQRQGEVKP